MALLRGLGPCLRLILCLCLLMGLATRPALAGPEEAAERQHLARQRASAELAFAQAQAACTPEFAVTACVDAARQRRRAAMQAIALAQNRLDDSERLARRDQRQVGVAQRRAEHAAATASVASQPAASSPAASSPAVPSPSRVRSDQSTAAGLPVPAASAAPRLKTEPAHSTRTLPNADADAAARYRQRQQQAAEHAEAVRQRNANLDARNQARVLAKGAAASSAAAAGLPLPAAAMPDTPALAKPVR